MGPFDMFATGVLVPALVTLVVFVGACRPWRRQRNAEVGRWALPLGLGVGYALGQGLMYGWGAVVPQPGSDESLIWLAVIAAVVGAADASRTWPWYLRWVVHAAIFGLAACLVAFGLAANEFNATVAMWLTVAFAIAMVVAWALLDVLARCTATWLVTAALLIVATLLTGLLIVSGTITHGMMGRTLAVVTGVTFAYVLWDRRLSLARGGLTVFVMLLAGLLLLGYFRNFHDEQTIQMTRASFIVMFLAPFAAWLGRLPVLSRRVWLGTLTSLAAVTLIAALALTLAILSSPPLIPGDNSDGSYGDLSTLPY